MHLPIHASWLNQIEIQVSILRRKALTPAEFASLETAAQRIPGFEQHYQQIAQPFELNGDSPAAISPGFRSAQLNTITSVQQVRMRHRTSVPKE